MFSDGNKVDALVFVFANAGEKAAYEKVLPLYFPRNKAEQVKMMNFGIKNHDFCIKNDEFCIPQYRAVALLPEDVGNESGETVVAERQVRVGESYHAAAAATHGLAVRSRHHLLPATCYLLLATCYSLPATCYLLLATCYLLLATCYLLCCLLLCNLLLALLLASLQLAACGVLLARLTVCRCDLWCAYRPCSVATSSKRM